MSLVLQNVRVSYGPREVVRGVSFAVRGGELCALLGLNGSGKSTLLKAVCGLLKCEAEGITVDGASLLGMHEGLRARQIAFIPQRTSAATGLTVADLVYMGYNPWLGLLDRPSRAQRAAALALLYLVGLDGYADRLFDQLSEGQRQLAVFARALVQDAPVMLLDEPDSALDYVNRHQLLGRMAQLTRAGGKAGVITLHDPNFAMAYCDRLLLLKDGVLAGDVDMGATTDEDLGAALSLLYGPVRVAREAGQRYMIRAERSQP